MCRVCSMQPRVVGDRQEDGGLMYEDGKVVLAREGDVEVNATC